jgi:hypothetical protein
MQIFNGRVDWAGDPVAPALAGVGRLRCCMSPVNRGKSSAMKTPPPLWFALGLLASAALAQDGRPDAPRYTRDGDLIRPEDYREWVFLSGGLGMTYTEPNAAKAARAPRFDNVFVNPTAYRAFLKTGTWPDKTVFILEVRGSGTSASINKGGHYQEAIVGMEAHVKDEARFPGTKWGFFNLGTSGASGKPLPANSSCQTCHEAHGAVDQTFVQFYPTLIDIAKAKGTYRETSAK